MAGKGKHSPPILALGLMSGTSMDGIDLALVRTDGQDHVERGPSGARDYEAAFRRRLATALDVAAAIENREERPGELSDIERELTLRHVDAANGFLTEQGLNPADIGVIGFHGQTVIHRPEIGLTVQLGDGQLLAEQTGIPVVFDLRANDMVHGGQGAPLVPAWHCALAENLPEPMRDIPPVAFVNIGGIANITVIDRHGKPTAFDTGPGNALIDQWVAAHAGIPYDAGGAVAAEGAVLPALVNRYLDQPFFARKAPKSLDRNDFSPPEPHEAALEDGARTLAQVTARSIWAAGELVAERPRLWIICGGGRHNRAIMDDLRDFAAEETAAGSQEFQVVTAEEAELDGDAMEAEAWAYLAVRSLQGLPVTWPSTTGVDEPRTGGVMFVPIQSGRAVGG